VRNRLIDKTGPSIESGGMKRHARLFKTAVALDKDLIRPVDENVRNRGVLEQLVQRTQTEELAQDVGDQLLSLEQAQRRRLRLGVEHRRNQSADLGLGVLAANHGEPVEIQPVQQIRVNPAFDFLVLRMPRVCTHRPRREGSDRVHPRRPESRPNSPLLSLSFDSLGPFTPASM
jgi:hypothetical protein